MRVPIGEPMPLQGSGPRSGVIKTIAAHRDVVEGALVLPERRGYESQPGPERGKQPGIERRHGAGSSHHRRRAVHKDVVPGVGVGVGGHVGNHAALAVFCACRGGRRADLKSLDGKQGGIAAAGSLAVGFARIVIPDRLCRRGFVGAAAGDDMGAGRRAIHIGRGRSAVARIVVAGRGKHRHAAGGRRFSRRLHLLGGRCSPLRFVRAPGDGAHAASVGCSLGHCRADVLRPVHANGCGLAGGRIVGGARHLDIERDLVVRLAGRAALVGLVLGSIH